MFSNTSTTSSTSEEEEEETEEFEFNSARFENDNDDEEDEITPEIAIENQKIFEDFVKKELETIKERINEMEIFFRKYFLKTSENEDDFGEIYFETNVQKMIMQSTKEIIKNQKSPSLKKFKTFVTKDRELFTKILQKLKESIIKTEELLVKLKRLGKFENISSLLNRQLHSIQLLKDVIENPTKIPKQSHLLRHRSTIEYGTNEHYDGISRMSQEDDEIYGFVGDEGEYVNLTIYGSQTHQLLGYIGAEKNKFLKEITKIFQHPKFS
uniref:Uncharacterized protein n=1 Tax=Panagrolaimus sp. ES5 TaxID=591445 RepID=A0AC34FT92_9BILA